MLLFYFKTPLTPSPATIITPEISNQKQWTPIDQPVAQPINLPETTNPPIPPVTKEKYTINAAIDYDRHLINVEETVVYPNRSGRELNSLVLAVASNLSPDCFTLTNLKVDQIDSDYELNGQRLEIPLQTPLAPDSAIKLTLRFSLALPYIGQFNTLNSPVFGYSDVQMNLINWYPFVVPFIDGEWNLHDPLYYGENLTYPSADYEVYVVFPKQEEIPVVAASGEAESIGAITRYTLENGRAFALSISPDFQVSTMRVGDVTIYSYSLPLYQRPAEAALQTSTLALDYFSMKFGPYPHKTLSIVQADLNDSREFSGLFFLSRNFYQLYDGTDKNYLTFTSLHSVAHQWWFDQVANDPAMEPWLDESLATWSESLYLEQFNPDVLPYWWTNRVDFFRPQGKIDISIYESQGYDSYKQSVYFNGTHFINDLRERVGEETFSDFLEDYVIQTQGQVATSEDFFRILDEHTKVDYSDLLERYFANK